MVDVPGLGAIVNALAGEGWHTPWARSGNEARLSLWRFEIGVRADAQKLDRPPWHRLVNQ